VCDTIANYLEELFQAVEATISDPSTENIDRLRELYERGK